MNSPIPHVERFKEIFAALTAGENGIPPEVAVDATAAMMEYEEAIRPMNQPGEFLGYLKTPNLDVEANYFKVFTFDEVADKLQSGELVLYKGGLYKPKEADSYLPFTAAHATTDDIGIDEETAETVRHDGQEFRMIIPIKKIVPAPDDTPPGAA